MAAKCVRGRKVVIVTGAYLSATLAHVRLFAGVNALVDSQRGPLDELLAAVGVVAYVRTDATVDPLC